LFCDSLKLPLLRDKLLSEKFSLLTQTKLAVNDSERLTDYNVTLEGRLNDLKIEMERTEEICARAREEMEVRKLAPKFKH
jgi:hypothetical protein